LLVDSSFWWGVKVVAAVPLADLKMEALKMYLVAQEEAPVATAWTLALACRAVAVLKVVKVEKATAAAVRAAVAAPVEEWGSDAGETKKVLRLELLLVGKLWPRVSEIGERR
jgi:hypothetical protein